MNKIIITVILSFMILAVCGQDYFKGIYDNPEPQEQIQEKIVDLLVAELKKEHPEADLNHTRFIAWSAILTDSRKNLLKYLPLIADLDDEPQDYIDLFCRAYQLMLKGEDYYSYKAYYGAAHIKIKKFPLSYFLLRDARNGRLMHTMYLRQVDKFFALIQAGIIKNELMIYFWQSIIRHTFNMSIIAETLPPETDPWLKAMISGIGALDRCQHLSAFYRSPDSKFAYKRQQYYENLERARKYFQQALELRPEWKFPCQYLIRIEANLGNADACAENFRLLVKYHPDWPPAYREITEAFCRLKRSYNLIELVNTAMPRVPQLAVDMLKRISLEEQEWFWRNYYLQPEIIEAMDRLYQQTSDEEQLINRILHEMNTLRYDSAQQLAKDIDFAAVVKRYTFPKRNQIPVYYKDPAIRLELFCGPHRKRLRLAELMYLSGNGTVAHNRLRELLDNHEFSPPAKDHLINLMASYVLPVYGKDYMLEEKHNYSRQNLPNDAFLVACLAGRLMTAREMLERGYNYRQYEPYPGFTAIMVAQSGTDPAALDFLKELGDPLTRFNKNQYSPLKQAASVNHKIMVERLLKLGIPIDGPKPNDWSPMLLALRSNQLKTARFLVESGADTSLMLQNLVHMTDFEAPLETIEFILPFVKDVNQPGRRGETALCNAAAKTDDPRVIEALLKAGADPSQADKKGRIPADLIRQRFGDKINFPLAPTESD